MCYMAMHDVAPSAVTMAVATDAIICIMNLNVSLLVMIIDLLKVNTLFVISSDHSSLSSRLSAAHGEISIYLWLRWS